MDVVGSLGYSGQELVYFNHGLLAYVTGKCVCIIDVAVGPRELIWRHETGINKVTTNIVTQKFCIVPAIPKAPIEILSMQTMKVMSVLENPTNGATVDASFSRNGDLLCAVSDALDRNVFVFDVVAGNILFAYGLSKNLSAISFNPVDNNQLLLYGEEGISFGSIHDLLDAHVLKVVDLSYESKNTDSIVNFNDDESLITSAVWLPGSKAVFGTIAGHVYEADFNSNRVRCVGSLAADVHLQSPSYATTMLLTIDHLIIGVSDGALYWLPLSALLSDVDSLRHALVPMVVQLSVLKTPLCSLACDPTTQRLYAGLDSGAICKFNLQVAQKQRANEDEDPAGDDVLEQEETAVTAMGERVTTFQEGAVLCVCAVTTPIIGTSTAKIAKKSSHLLSMLVTGSHFGRINFWKQPACESEAIPVNSAGPLAVRRSAPKPLKLLNVQDLHQGFSPCTISPLPASVRDGTCSLGVGTAEGCLEVFKFDAIETDDDDDEPGENASPIDEVRLFGYAAR
jgi:hypothetical protein